MSSSSMIQVVFVAILVVSGLAKKAPCPVVRCPAPPTDCAYTTSTATGANGCLLNPCGVLNCDALNDMHVDEDAPCANGECMETESNMVQLGAMPYLFGGGGNNHQDSELACKEQCLAHPTCKYG